MLRIAPVGMTMMPFVTLCDGYRAMSLRTQGNAAHAITIDGQPPIERKADSHVVSD